MVVFFNCFFTRHSAAEVVTLLVGLLKSEGAIPPDDEPDP